MPLPFTDRPRDRPRRTVVRSPRRWKSLRRLSAGLSAILAVLIFGTAAYMLAGWSLDDAAYMVVISITTVGYNEVRPIDTAWLRGVTLLIICLGYGALSYTLASLIALLTEEELQRYLGSQRVKRQIESLKNHIIVVGLGRMGSQVCSELFAARVPFVVIDRDPEKIDDCERRQWLGIQGDATEESILGEAVLDRARALVTTVPDDAFNVFITLTARGLNPKVEILVRAELQSTQKKLERAGADYVVLPTAIGAQRIVTLLTNPAAFSFAELVTTRGTLEIEMDEVEIVPNGPLINRSLRDLDIGRRTGVIVIAVKRADGHVEFPPTGSVPLAQADRIVLIGRRDNLDQFRAAYRATPQ